MDDWFQMAKDYAKAEKELKIENWVQISICYGYGHQSVILYTYDLPREVYERRMWESDGGWPDCNASIRGMMCTLLFTTTTSVQESRLK